MKKVLSKINELIINGNPDEQFLSVSYQRYYAALAEVANTVLESKAELFNIIVNLNDSHERDKLMRILM